MTHLVPDEFVDAVEGALAPARRVHLEACDSCRREVEQLAATLTDVRAVSLAEPSPLFWDHFAARVRASVAAAGATPPRERRWFEWPVLAPVGALALVVLALAWSVPHGSTDLARAPLAVLAPEPAAPGIASDVDERWAMLFDLVGEVDVDAAMESGFIGRPGTADVAVRHLSSEERLELMRLLEEELHPGG